MTFTEQLPAILVVIPLVAAAITVLTSERAVSWGIASAASAAVLAVSILVVRQVIDGNTLQYVMGGWSPPFGIELRIGGFAALALLIVSGASTVALLFGRRSLDDEIPGVISNYFYAAWLLVLAGLVGIVIAGDAFNIFVFMEISALATYTLIAAGPDPRALPAVFKYLIMGTIGATFYLIGIGLVYMMTGTLNFADMEARIADIPQLRPVIVAAAFITVGLAIKAAAFPFHTWLPNAYTYAPSVVTVFLAACSTKVSIYVLLRFDFFVFQQNFEGHDVQFSGFLMPLAALALIVASVVAIFERNLKRLLAFSSIAQIGYILLGASLLTISGLTGGILHLFNHALIKATLFMSVTCLVLRCGSAQLEDLAGAGARMPWTMAAFVVSGLGLIGVPLTAGFVSKWYLAIAALEHATLGWLLLGLIVGSSLLAAIYVWRVVEVAYFRPPAETVEGVTEAPLSMLLSVWLMVAAVVYFGIDARLPLQLATGAAELLLGSVR